MTRSVEIADAGHQLKAWVNFDGTVSGTITSSNGIRDAFNITSISNHPNGQYTINLASGLMANENYCVVSMGTFDEGSYLTAIAIAQDTSPSATAFKIASVATNNLAVIMDSTYVYIAIFGY